MASFLRADLFFASEINSVSGILFYLRHGRFKNIYNDNTCDNKKQAKSSWIIYCLMIDHKTEYGDEE